MGKTLIEIDNPMTIERKQQEPPETIYAEKDVKCACGCGRWSADGFETEHGDYIFDKDCYYTLSLQAGWLRKVG